MPEMLIKPYVLHFSEIQIFMILTEIWDFLQNVPFPHVQNSENPCHFCDFDKILDGFNLFYGGKAPKPLEKQVKLRNSRQKRCPDL